jgi:CHAT domain-containing protein
MGSSAETDRAARVGAGIRRVDGRRAPSSVLAAGGVIPPFSCVPMWSIRVGGESIAAACPNGAWFPHARRNIICSGGSWVLHHNEGVRMRARRRVRDNGWVVVMFLTVLATTDGSESVALSETTAAVDSLYTVVDSLRVHGRYGDALGIATNIRSILQADSTVKSYQLVDNHQLLRTLQFATALPESSQMELAAADRLTPRIQRALMRGQHAEGEEYATRQLDIRQRYLGGSNLDVATSLNYLGLILTAHGDYARAEPLYRRALNIRKWILGEQHPVVARSLHNLSTLLALRGDYESSEPLAREALLIRRKLLGEEHPDVARTLGRLAGILYARGDYDGAEPLARESLLMARKLLGDKHPDVAADIGNLSLVWTALKRYADAESLNREALAAERRFFGEEHFTVASSISNLASLLHTRGDLENAEPLYRESLAMRRKVLGDQHPDVAMNLVNLGQLLHELGDLTGAEAPFREALAIQRRALGQEHPSVAAGLYGLGKVFRARGDYAAAESLLDQAANVFESARLRVGRGRDRATFLESPYLALAATRLELHKEAAAWSAVEKSQGRALADLLLAARSRNLSDDEARQEDSLRIVLGDLEQRLDALARTTQADTSAQARRKMEETRTLLLEIEAKWSAFERELAAKHPVTEGQSYDLAQVQRALHADEAIVGWLEMPPEPASRRSLDRDTWGYVVRREGPVTWEALTTTKSNDAGGRDGGPTLSLGVEPLPPRLAERYRMAMTDTSEVLRAGNLEPVLGGQLFAERLAPLMKHLTGVRNLIILPSGEMLGIPIESLPLDDNQTVGTRFAVSYAPSATVLTWLREEKRGSGVQDGSPPALFVGDPQFSEDQSRVVEEERSPSGWSLVSIPESLLVRSAVAGSAAALNKIPRLPATRQEVLALSELFPQSTVLLGMDASEQRLTMLARAGDLQRFRVIHLATHAWINTDYAEESSLLLSRVNLPDPLEAAEKGERIFDGRITTKEILKEWKLNADLVILSGCQTALGRKIAGEGYIGLAYAFLQAGASSLVVSLWPVEDQATSLLMQRFYENLYGRIQPGGRSMSKRDALREAKEWLRAYRADDGTRPYVHPFYWASFILFGNPD